MTVWITKYALTAGIKKYEAEKLNNDMVKVQEPGCFVMYFHGRQWHADLGSAIAKAEVMREAKIKSLEKSLAKLKKMSFGSVK